VGIAVAAALTAVGQEYGEDPVGKHAAPVESIVVEEDEPAGASIVVEED
jgi:hypothetical protein